MNPINRHRVICSSDLDTIKEILPDIIGFNRLKPSDKQLLDKRWKDDQIINQMSIEDCLIDYSKTLTCWNVILQAFEDKEEYEICDKILKIIQIEQDEWLRIIKLYHQDYTESIDDLFIKMNKTINKWTRKK